MSATLIRPRRRRLRAAVTALLLVAATAAAVPEAVAAPHAAAPLPTVVLVHGAWADTGSWSDVIERLQRDGYTVDAFATPLQRLGTDSQALADYLATIAGPIVLVGHSYGGAVITDAATGNPNVKALVYIDAFAPAEGEAIGGLTGAGSVLVTHDSSELFIPVPLAPPTATTELYLQPDAFVSYIANDLPAKKARTLAATQRPLEYGALGDASSAPAWASIPSWYEVGTLDQVITPQSQLDMAHRAGSTVVEARTGHLPMVSDPGAVTRTVEAAAAGTEARS